MLCSFLPTVNVNGSSPTRHRSQAVLQDGVHGIGGTEIIAVISAALQLNFLTYDKWGWCKFRLMETAIQLAPLLSETNTIHAELIPGSPYGHFNLLILKSSGPMLPPLESAAAEQRKADSRNWAATQAAEEAKARKAANEKAAREKAASEKAAHEKAAHEARQWVRATGG